LPDDLQILPTENLGERNLPGRPLGPVSTGEVLNLLNDCVKFPTHALLRSTVPALGAASSELTKQASGQSGKARQAPAFRRGWAQRAIILSDPATPAGLPDLPCRFGR
jgi:hypothetical protein